MLLGPSPGIDKERVSGEVSQQVQSWRSSTESGDINALIRKYAPSVQYYRKSGASPDFIRSDKQRAYRMFDSMSIRISNMDVNISDSGETATAHFDKEWVFEGSRRSTGKVRQQLQFRRMNGQWMITGERDIRVYYTN
jgi:ketosteroid isomerase-like protein